MCFYLVFFEGVDIVFGIVIFDYCVGVEFCGDQYDLRSECLFYIIVFWVGIDGSIDLVIIVYCYLKQNIIICGELKFVVMVCVLYGIIMDLFIDK